MHAPIILEANNYVFSLYIYVYSISILPVKATVSHQSRRDNTRVSMYTYIYINDYIQHVK